MTAAPSALRALLRPVLLALPALLAIAALPALAHHGWRWTTGENLELTGVIREARLGNPHGVLTVQAEDETWTVEVGQPWRNARAGLTDEMLAPGREAVFVGEPSADLADRRLKAERIVIAGVTHDLYPDRD
ncbi:MAG: DUF6152 family protein [Pseudomonadota bacterium]|nr:DUF6152 family protein [Pseudomonadota bacterium]